MLLYNANGRHGRLAAGDTELFFMEDCFRCMDWFGIIWSLIWNRKSCHDNLFATNYYTFEVISIGSYIRGWPFLSFFSFRAIFYHNKEIDLSLDKWERMRVLFV